MLLSPRRPQNTDTHTYTIFGCRRTHYEADIISAETYQAEKKKQKQKGDEKIEL